MTEIITVLKREPIIDKYSILPILFVLLIFINAHTCFAMKSVAGVNASGGRNRSLSVDPTGSVEGYSAVLYNNTNGLPTSEANAITETKEGFIWIGSYGGLIRYDGHSFVRLDSTTGVASVVFLYTDSKDRLWIGTNDSGVFMMYRDELLKWGKAEGLKSSYVYSIAEDRRGNMYIATNEGLMIIDPSMELRNFGDPRVDDAYIRSLRKSNDGYIYGIDVDGNIFTILDGKIDTYLDSDTSPVKGVMSILPDTDNLGYVYLGTETSQVYYGNLKNGFSDMETYDISPITYVENFEKIDGKLWICGGNGIGTVWDGNFYKLDNVPMNNSVGHAMTDYEGNLWFTSTRQGVMKITPNQFSNLYERYGLPATVVNSTCLYNDMLFVGTDNGLTVLDDEGPLSELPLTKAETASGVPIEATDLFELLGGCRIRSVIRDSQNNLWISSWRKIGLLRYDGNKATVFTEEDGLLSDRVRTVCERRDGSLLVVSTGGVSIIEGDRVVKSDREKDGGISAESLTVAEGMNGDIILGTDGGGLYIISENGVQNLNIKDGLSSEIIMRIKRDPIRDLFWIVTSNSIAYMTADYKITTITNFPYSNNFDIYENKVGDLWVFSSNGIYVTPAEEMLDNKNLNPVYYGIFNGLPCIPTANSYSYLDDNGNLYMAGSTGVGKVNIDDTHGNVNTLKVAVPYIDADGIRMYPDNSGKFTVSSHVRRLTIYSFVYNYSLSNPLVSYQLNGFDKKSITVNRSELVPIDYTNLPGGTYYFTVKLMDAMGRGNRSFAIQITKEKAFYEYPWFYAVMGLLVLACVVAGVRMYVARRMHLLELKHQAEAERERLVTELKMATQIQESMLPNTFPAYPDRKEFDIYASMEPAREVGGDFYDFYLIDDDHLGIVIADVSGKGVPASLFMMRAKTIVQSYAMLGITAGEILSRTNESLCNSNDMEMFVTAWVGVLEISTGIITAANAGHEYPMIYRSADDTYTMLKDKHGFVMGGLEGMFYKEYKIELHPGDKLFLYTDGVPEATDSNNELFGANRMLEALNAKTRVMPKEVLGNVRESVTVFVGSAEQFDDLTMLCLEYRGPSTSAEG